MKTKISSSVTVSKKISNPGNETANITTDFAEIKQIINEYYV